MSFHRSRSGFSKKCLRRISAAVLTVFVLFLASCERAPVVYVAETVDLDELYMMRTTEGIEAASETEPDTVYWVKSGSTWHTNRNCHSLKKSSEIISGSVEEAKAAGKERKCKVCQT